MKKIIAAVCAALFIASFSLTAFADTEINNSIKGDSDNQTTFTPSVSGAELIRATGDQDKIIMPDYNSYYEHPAVRYIDAPKNHSIYVYKDPYVDLTKEVSQSQKMPAVHEGIKVLAVAQQNGLSCIIYQDREFNKHAGWSETKYLSSTFPGSEEVIGAPFAGTTADTTVPGMTWSKEPFVGTNHKYVSFANSVDNCTQFKLAYQVTNLDNVSFNDTLGVRTIYVNDGSGWTEAGQFEYNAQGAVLITVNMKEAMDLKAVAVIPSCNAPDNFLYRIEIQDISVCE